MAVLTAQRRGHWTWLLAFALVAGWCAPLSRAASAPPSENQVKAAFLLNFTAFIEWPKTAFSDEKAPIVIGVLGEDPFGKILDELLAGETVSGRPLELRRLARGADLSRCHLLFISDSERTRWADILGQLRGRPCVTVANGPDFVRGGGVIEFTQERGRIRFRINQAPLQPYQVSISSKLLRLAQPN